MTTELVDVAYTPKERKEQKAEMASGPTSKGTEYPWGLTLALNDETLDKLGYDKENLPKAGDELHIHAIAKVTSVSMRDDDGRGKDCCVSLQITHLACMDEDEEGDNGEMVEERGTAKAAKRTVASYYREGKE